MSTPIVLSEQTQDFYAALHRGGTHAFAQEMGKFTTTYWWRVGEPMRIPPVTAGAAIYVGVNPVTARVTPEDRARDIFQGKPDKWIERRVASKDRTIECVNCLYREYDGKDFTGATKKADKERIYQTNPAHYKALALAHVRNLNPQPSAVVDSGGGYNCYWLLAETFFIGNDDDRTRIQDIQKRWVQMDPAADQSVHDLRRIFRPPGSINFKELYAPNYPTVSFVKCDLSLTFPIESLRSRLPVVAATPSPTRQPTHNQARATAAPIDPSSSVIRAYNEAHRIEESALAYGYTPNYGDKWNRPGSKNRCVTMFKTTNTMLSWSENDPAYNDHKPIDPFCLFRIYEHNGDMRAAVKAAAIELGIEKKTVPTEQTFTAHQWIYASQCWLVGADFAAIIPKHLQSAKGYRTAATDKRAFSAVLNVLGEYGKLNGPISNQQGHLRSGLSEGSFRNAMARLMEAGLVRRITPPEAMTDGAYWYELNTCVLCAVGVVKQVELPRAKYASVFDSEKTEDAWQLGGSKKQRAIATIKSAGPDLLLAVSVLAVGERIHQAVLGKRMHMSEFATSRLVRKMQYFAIVSTECVGRQQYITLLPNWRETIANNTPSMPTYGNKFRRELNAHVRTGENCDRKLARGLGDKEKLAAKREEAARKAFAMMESEMAKQYTDLDILSEKMRRLLRADSLKRTAATGEKTARTVEIAMHRNQQAKPWFSQSSPFEERRTERMMQELYDNELLIDAREQLKQGA